MTQAPDWWIGRGNLKRWLLELADGEPIEAVVIGRMGWGDYGSDSVPGYAEHRRNVPLSWAEAAPQLDYDFDPGYGAPACEAVYAWTRTKVIAISQYDGATQPFAIPRNPTACEPEMPGG